MKVEELIALCEQFREELLIVLVSNVRGKTTAGLNFQGNSAESEYYSSQQHEEIMNCLLSKGFHVKNYFEEIDFIADYVSDYHEGTIPQNICVINSAQKGIHAGRKSLIPAFCDLRGIMHTGSDAYTVSFSRQKEHWTAFAQNAALPVCDSWYYDRYCGWIGQTPPPGKKVIVKLCGESSSIGLGDSSIFEYSPLRDSELSQITKLYGKRLIVSEFIPGLEVEVPFLAMPEGTFVFPPTGISLDNNAFLGNSILNYGIRGNHKFEYYNFDQQYPQFSKEIIHCTARASKIFGIKGLGRIDYRMTEEGDYRITDIATNPHLTRTMTFGYVFQEAGFDYGSVFEVLVGAALKWREL